MNELITQARELPDTLADLSNFVIVERARLKAVRDLIRDIDKIGVAKEVHEQKLLEAQEIAEAVLDAETKLGELTSEMKKAANQYSAKDNGVRSKSEQLKEIGITEKQKQRFETLAKHPEQVEKAKEDARARGEIVTRQDVFKEINSQYENRKQTKSRELKEAKERAAEFENTKVVSMDAIKQNSKDNKKIYSEFWELSHQVKSTILKMAMALNNELILKAIRATDKGDLIEMRDRLQDDFRRIIKMQKIIEEVINEK